MILHTIYIYIYHLDHVYTINNVTAAPRSSSPPSQSIMNYSIHIYIYIYM